MAEQGEVKRKSLKDLVAQLKPEDLVVSPEAFEKARVENLSPQEMRKQGVLRRGRPPLSRNPIAETSTTAIFDPKTARRAGWTQKEIEEHMITQQELPEKS